MVIMKYSTIKFNDSFIVAICRNTLKSFKKTISMSNLKFCSYFNQRLTPNTKISDICRCDFNQHEILNQNHQWKKGVQKCNKAEVFGSYRTFCHWNMVFYRLSRKIFDYNFKINEATGFIFFIISLHMSINIAAKLFVY